MTASRVWHEETTHILTDVPEMLIIKIERKAKFKRQKQ